MSKISLDVSERRVFTFVETDDPDVISGAAFGEDVTLTRVGCECCPGDLGFGRRRGNGHT